MWINRESEVALTQAAATRHALVVTGCRQAGKTSLLQKVFPKARYVTLDIPRDAAEAEEAGDAFLARNPPPVILDEVQYAPALLRYVKRWIDRHREATGQFLITGSQKFTLMKGVTESLAGRAAVLVLHGLSAREYERWAGGRLEGDALWEWIWKGSYPELHAQGLRPDRFYADYLATYLERDVRQIIEVRNLRDFDRFLRLCAVRTGQLVSYSAWAGDIGVSTNTIKSWLSVLEASHVICLLEPYYQNLGKRIVKAPKLYFLDTGLACYLAGVRTPGDLAANPLLGAMFETHVLGQILRHFQNRGETPSVYFYRDHSGHEVDFVIPEGQALRLIECKVAAWPGGAVRGFEEIRRLAGPRRVLSETVITAERGCRVLKGGLRLDDSIELAGLES
ncbi:MAG: ATP-binding protein [Planctomycetota bacterium]